MDINRIAAQIEQRLLAACARPITVKLSGQMAEAKACGGEAELVQCIAGEIRSHGRVNGLDIWTLQTDVGSEKQLRAVLVIEVRSPLSGAPVPRTKALEELSQRLRESGGRLSLRTIGGQWTRYEFAFPAIPAEECAISGSFPVSKRETILLVEDEDYVRDITTEVLESCGYVVIPARDAAHGVEEFFRHRESIDLLLTDVVMPGGSGKGLAKRLTAEDPLLKVIFMSGYTDNAIARQEFMDASTAYLQKPFSLDALLSKIREELDKPLCLDPESLMKAGPESTIALAGSQTEAALGGATAD